jgi:hypothetical protein
MQGLGMPGLTRLAERGHVFRRGTALAVRGEFFDAAQKTGSRRRFSLGILGSLGAAARVRAPAPVLL